MFKSIFIAIIDVIKKYQLFLITLIKILYITFLLIGEIKKKQCNICNNMLIN